MELFLKIMLTVFSIGLIIIVLLQQSKSSGLSGSITGGAEHLFGKQKARGIDLILQRLTIILAIGFFLLAIFIAFVVNN